MPSPFDSRLTALDLAIRLNGPGTSTSAVLHDADRFLEFLTATRVPGDIVVNISLPAGLTDREVGDAVTSAVKRRRRS